MAIERIYDDVIDMNISVHLKEGTFSQVALNHSVCHKVLNDRVSETINEVLETMKVQDGCSISIITKSLDCSEPNEISATNMTSHYFERGFKTVSFYDKMHRALAADKSNGV